MSTTAEAPRATARKKGADKEVKATASATRKRPQYPENVKVAAKRANELLASGMKPGPKQHVAVRKVLGDRDPVELSGLSLTALRKYATGETTYESRTAPETARLRALAEEIAEATKDPLIFNYTKGRSLAAILVAYAEERKAKKK